MNANSITSQTYDEMPFILHLYELRKRLLIWFCAFLIFSVIGYLIRDQLLSLLVAPLNQSLYYTSPTGGIEIALKVSAVFGFLLSLPILIYESLRFVQPAFSKKTNRHIITLLFLGILLMLVGISISYLFLLPASLYFLTNFSTGDIQNLITVNEYFSFIIFYLVGFGIMFELPLLILTINSIVRLHPKKLLSYFKFVFLGSFVASAIITPTPDVMNMTFLALPIIVLYLLSIIPIWILNRHR